MKPGSVVVDVAIDQGGCFETSRPTTHADPVYVVDGVTHYCVANMPGGVPRTSTFALNNATLPFVLALAGKGWKKALADDPHLRNGLNIAFGKVTCRPVAEALAHAYVRPPRVMRADPRADGTVASTNSSRSSRHPRDLCWNRMKRALATLRASNIPPAVLVASRFRAAFACSSRLSGLEFVFAERQIRRALLSFFSSALGHAATFPAPPRRHS
jgi:hypothetical protein